VSLVVRRISESGDRVQKFQHVGRIFAHHFAFFLVELLGTFHRDLKTKNTGKKLVVGIGKLFSRVIFGWQELQGIMTVSRVRDEL